MKLSVIGGGGVRSMFLAKSIAQRAEELHINELVFMDNDAEKLRIFGGMARHVASVLAPGMAFTLTDNAVDAVRDADYVITTIRAGGDAARARDEHIALDEGVLGQETTGAAGFAFAMRSIPILLSYCELIRKHAKPGVKVFNFTNPVGIVSQALRDAGYDFTYGICDAPSGMLSQFAAMYGVAGNEARGELFGLNHLSWFHTVEIGGRDVMPEIMRNPLSRTQSDMRFFTPDMLAYAGCVPNEYLYYYYAPEQAVHNILKAGRTRGDDIEEINRHMLADMASLNPDTDFDECLRVFTQWYGLRESRYMAGETGVKRNITWSFDMHSPDAGGYAGVALRFIEIEQSGGRGEMIVCVPNEGAVSFLEDTDTVEVTCDVQNGCAVPHHFPNIPDAQRELIRRVKYYERIGARAILNRDMRGAIECLALHPLVNSVAIACRLAKRYTELNEPFTGVWRDHA